MGKVNFFGRHRRLKIAVFLPVWKQNQIFLLLFARLQANVFYFSASFGGQGCVQQYIRTFSRRGGVFRSQGCPPSFTPMYVFPFFAGRANNVLFQRGQINSLFVQRIQCQGASGDSGRRARCVFFCTASLCVQCAIGGWIMRNCCF